MAAPLMLGVEERVWQCSEVPTLARLILFGRAPTLA
jgi:hypothetical protein